MGPEPVEGSALQDAILARLVRREAGLIVAQLHRRLGDFDVAEEAVQEASAIALRTWRRDGVPPNPAGWLALTARRRAIDLLRRRAREVELSEEITPDRSAGRAGGRPARATNGCRCCSAAATRRLSVEARLALTLAGRGRACRRRRSPVRSWCPRRRWPSGWSGRSARSPRPGFPSPFLRLSDLAPRLDDVLTVVYLSYNAGYLDPSAAGRELSDDAVWLAELVARALPEQAEAWGLLALLTFLSARTRARFDDQQQLVLLADQDRSLWDGVMISRADGYLRTAAGLHQPGRFQLQAALAGCHATAPSWAETDWLQILTLYDMLQQHDSSPVIKLNAAIALSHVRGPARCSRSGRCDGRTAGGLPPAARDAGASAGRAR